MDDIKQYILGDWAVISGFNTGKLFFGIGIN